MATAKEHIAELIKRQPDDSSYDEIVRELAFDLMVQLLREITRSLGINTKPKSRARFGFSSTSITA